MKVGVEGVYDGPNLIVGSYAMVCPLPPKDCRIAELVGMNLQQAANFGELVGKHESLKSERDAALAESHKRGEEVVALRWALRLNCYVEGCFCSREATTHFHTPACSKSQEALSNTSATAQQTVQRIERKVREAVWSAVKDMWGASPVQFRAAILGEKEKP